MSCLTTEKSVAEQDVIQRMLGPMTLQAQTMKYSLREWVKKSKAYLKTTYPKQLRHLTRKLPYSFQMKGKSKWYGVAGPHALDT